MKALIGAAVLSAGLAVSQQAVAQTPVKLSNPCINVFQPGTLFPLEFKVVPSLFGDAGQQKAGEELESIARSILNAIGVTREISVHHTPDVPNACATMDAQRRRVVYVSATWLDGYVDSKRWGKIAVIAHEIGHHLNNHTVEDELGHWLREYEADKFAGRVIRLLGGSAQDARLAVEKQPVFGSDTHPPRSLRVAAILEGYGETALADAIPSSLRTRPEAQIPVRELSVSKEVPKLNADIVQKQRVTPEAGAVREDIVRSQIGYLFSDSRDERSFAYSNLLASSRNDVNSLSQMIDYALNEPDNARGVINVISFLKLVDKEVLKSMRPKILTLIDNPKIADNGPQTRDVIEDLRRLLR